MTQSWKKNFFYWEKKDCGTLRGPLNGQIQGVPNNSASISVFWLYCGGDAVRIQWKLCFRFWVLLFSWSSNICYNPLSQCKARQLPVGHGLMRHWPHCPQQCPVLLSSNVWQVRCVKCTFDLQYCQCTMGLLGWNFPGSEEASIFTLWGFSGEKTERDAKPSRWNNCWRLPKS